jgi:hypothetical protein
LQARRYETARSLFSVAISANKNRIRFAVTPSLRRAELQVMRDALYFGPCKATHETRFTILLPVHRPPAMLPYAIETVLAHRARHLVRPGGRRGVFNHAAEMLFGMQQPLLRGESMWPGWRVLGEVDPVHRGPGARRYIWRWAVLQAEPREEIAIGNAEIETVERELSSYQLYQAAT